MSEPINHRSVYAAGYYNGLRDAKITTEGESMNVAKYEQQYRGLSVQAKKVYDAVPMVDLWTTTQIMQELFRKSASMSDPHSVKGCINSLIDSGLVVEPSRGKFKRVEIREKKICTTPILVAVKQKDVEVKTIEVKVTHGTPMEISPLTALGDIAAGLRHLATKVENIAIQVAEKSEKDNADTEKMRQLQALLKSLG